MYFRTRRRGIALAAAAAAVLLTTTACGASNTGGDTDGGPTDGGSAAETVTIRIGYPHAATSADHLVLEEMMSRIAEKTENRVAIELFPDGQLGSNADLLDQAALGGDVAGFLDASSAAEMAQFPELGILSGPYLFEDREQAERFAASDLFAEWMGSVEESTGLKVLSMNWFETPRDILGKNAWPEPADLSGVTLRLPPLAAWLDTFEPLGVVPVTLAWGEVFGGLEQGVIEGVESPVNTFVQGHFEEVATDLTRTQHMLPWLGYAMSADVFNSLSAEDQQVLLEEFYQGGIDAADRNYAKAEDSLRVLEESGIAVHEADIAAYRAATEQFYTSDPLFADLQQQVLDAAR